MDAEELEKGAISSSKHFPKPGPVLDNIEDLEKWQTLPCPEGFLSGEGVRHRPRWSPACHKGSRSQGGPLEGQGQSMESV